MDRARPGTAAGQRHFHGRKLGLERRLTLGKDLILLSNLAQVFLGELALLLSEVKMPFGPRDLLM